MTSKPNWITRQLQQIREESKDWPLWRKRDALTRFKSTPADSILPTPAETLEDEPKLSLYLTDKWAEEMKLVDRCIAMYEQIEKEYTRFVIGALSTIVVLVSVICYLITRKT